MDITPFRTRIFGRTPCGCWYNPNYKHHRKCMEMWNNVIFDINLKHLVINQDCFGYLSRSIVMERTNVLDRYGECAFNLSTSTRVVVSTRFKNISQIGSFPQGSGKNNKKHETTTYRVAKGFSFHWTMDFFFKNALVQPHRPTSNSKHPAPARTWGKIASKTTTEVVLEVGGFVRIERIPRKGNKKKQSQMLNVWHIYLHLGTFGRKCR